MPKDRYGACAPMCASMWASMWASMLLVRRIYQERDTMRRHAPEILGATFLSSLFSFFSTAFAAKALGLQAMLARALIPRSVTVALALPISAQFDAPLAITAAAVLLQVRCQHGVQWAWVGGSGFLPEVPVHLPLCRKAPLCRKVPLTVSLQPAYSQTAYRPLPKTQLTRKRLCKSAVSGISPHSLCAASICLSVCLCLAVHMVPQGMLGANFGPGLMSALGFKDTIARGLAAAGTAGKNEHPPRACGYDGTGQAWPTASAGLLESSHSHSQVTLIRVVKSHFSA